MAARANGTVSRREPRTETTARTALDVTGTVHKTLGHLAAMGSLASLEYRENEHAIQQAQPAVQRNERLMVS